MVFSRTQCFEPQDEEYIETTEGCEEYMREFLSGRKLANQKFFEDELRDEHDMKYERELVYDEKDNAKGKGPFYKKYRKELKNTQSNCNAQYINNLHVYYGDGSKLKQTAKKQHYAVDFICPNGVDTDDTAKLKMLEVSKKRKSVLTWIRKNRSEGHLAYPLRRSYSCIEFPFDIPERTHITDPNGRFNADPFASLYNLDDGYASILKDSNLDIHSVCKNISTTAKFLISRVNASDYPVGKINIKKVMFSRENLYAYVIPAICDTQRNLKDFSSKFESWLKGHSERYQATFGTEHELRGKAHGGSNVSGKKKLYFFRVNVILCLSEFTDEGTRFRRARHVCHIAFNRDLYLEIDTGMLRIVETNENTVRRMPHEFAHIATSILEVRFEGAQTQEEVSARINDIRETGIAYIGRFDEGNRIQEQKKHYEGSSKKSWSSSETAVLLPLKKYPKPRMTTFFCGEAYCMGMCCTEGYVDKPEPTSPNMSTRTAWVAERDKKDKQSFEKKLKCTSNTSYLQPTIPTDNNVQLPTMNYLEPANMDSFFKR